MNITWYGTASIKITQGKTAILFDPFFSFNPAIHAANIEDFIGVSAIFITHGHFDHIMHLPEIMRYNRCEIYCGPTVSTTLQKLGIPPKNIHSIAHSDAFKIGPLAIQVYKSRHIQFDVRLILQTIFNPRMISKFKNLKTIIPAHCSMPMGEVFAFEIIHKKTNILHFGSLAYDTTEEYPCRPSLLTIPYQGRSDLKEHAMKFIQKFQPKAVCLHHFDDTFPPISSQVDISPLLTTTIPHIPQIHIIVPEYRKAVSI